MIADIIFNFLIDILLFRWVEHPKSKVGKFLNSHMFVVILLIAVLIAIVLINVFRVKGEN